MKNKKAPAASDGNFSFRKSMNGFKKEDVIGFISEQNRRSNEIIESLNEQLAVQAAKAEDATKALYSQRANYDIQIKNLN